MSALTTKELSAINRHFILYKNNLWKPFDKNYEIMLENIEEFYGLKMIVEDHLTVIGNFRTRTFYNSKKEIIYQLSDDFYISNDNFSITYYNNRIKNDNNRNIIIEYFLNKIYKLQLTYA